MVYCLGIVTNRDRLCYQLLFIDQHCIDLVQQHHLEVPLLKLLQKTEDLRVQHAVVSILKNLSLPSTFCLSSPVSYERFINPILLEQNKQSVGATGTIQIVSEYLDSSKDMLKPVQFAVIGILKLLSIGDGKTNRYFYMLL
jgi:hypothetical protein